MVFLMGPTGAGKTRLAVQIVRRLPFEIISVDSAMVYRGMDIGTGKPDAPTLRDAPHRLIDIRDPRDAYSAAQFRVDARREIGDIYAHDRVPLLVGGTGLYFRALSNGLAPLPGADRALRARLAARAGSVGWGCMHARLARVDPVSATRIHPNDPQRIQRALEVFELTGRPMSELLAQAPRAHLPVAPLGIVLAPGERRRLHHCIEQRFATMLARGLVGEVEGLRSIPGMCSDLPSMRAVGYRQVWEHLDGVTDRADMQQRAVAATRRLARRQLTWLRAEPDARWLASDSAGVLDELLNLLAAHCV